MHLLDASTRAPRQVMEGDNRVSARGLAGVADRVLLGLLPSSEGGWGLGVRCLKAGGGWLHVHGNVGEGQEGEWTGGLEVCVWKGRGGGGAQRAGGGGLPTAAL